MLGCLLGRKKRDLICNVRVSGWGGHFGEKQAMCPRVDVSRLILAASLILLNLMCQDKVLF